MKSNNVKRKAIGAVVAGSLVVSSLSGVFAQNLTDIDGHWAKERIQDWVAAELLSGYPDGSFKPDQSISRAEFMSLVNKSFDYTVEKEGSFSDVSKDEWFASVVAVANGAGYISGYDDETMKPNQPISRQEVATIITKIMKLEENVEQAAEFTDHEGIAQWSKGFIGAVSAARYMNGYPDGSFQAKKEMTRAEAVAALDKVISELSDGEGEVTDQEAVEAAAELMTDEVTYNAEANALTINFSEAPDAGVEFATRVGNGIGEFQTTTGQTVTLKVYGDTKVGDIDIFIRKGEATSVVESVYSRD
ncbi:S-layer domain protein [Alkaliphilus metalliredigens QYMF]|uniref:S-layer domain protein n=1 Tax=Alkaliphilus metalliredigens (strain QYMF) TaxID=293826 RepID=A6TK12_ALKMQ|nr:S-layer homology domain-containing protein [Alkaliphilus metalliredigens]ABR46530.1 S-layer domain protein [Alkaliphilus metalliredigens QYMF]